MRALLALLLAVAGSPAPTAGQSLQPELRVDAIGPAPATIEPGVGLIAPLGRYVRTGLAVGYGDRLRVDMLARFTLDPFRQQRWALSVGGGLSVRQRAFLAVVADLEGPEMRGWLPALQAGLGGGFRVGVALRRGVPGRR